MLQRIDTSKNRLSPAPVIKVLRWNKTVFTTFLVLAASLAVALVSLISTAFLYVSDETLKVWMPRLIAIAVGVLLGDAFLHLIPDALEITKDGSVVLWTLVGIISFFFIETALQWRHDHILETQTEGKNAPASFAVMNLFGDGIHNFVDGIIIASSFLVDPALGFATTLAIVLHEIPQEISDISILIQGGYNKKRAVFLNFMCATACILGAVLTLILSQLMELGLGAMLAFTAGGFIYIAASDLVPLLRSNELKVALPSQFAATMVGILSMQSILWFENIAH